MSARRGGWGKGKRKKGKSGGSGCLWVVALPLAVMVWMGKAVWWCVKVAVGPLVWAVGVLVKGGGELVVPDGAPDGMRKGIEEANKKRAGVWGSGVSGGDGKEVVVNVAELRALDEERWKWLAPVFRGNGLGGKEPKGGDGRATYMWRVLKYYFGEVEEGGEYPNDVRVLDAGLRGEVAALEAVAEEVIRCVTNWGSGEKWGQFWYRPEYLSKIGKEMAIVPFTPKRKGRF